VEQKKNANENTWIADWFMRCHVTNSLEGMYDLQEVTESVKLNDGNKVYAMKCSKLQTTVTMQEGMSMVIILDGV